MGRKPKSKPATVDDEDTLLAAAMEQASLERNTAAPAVAESPPEKPSDRRSEKKLVNACEHGQLVMVRELLGQGVNPNSRSYASATGDERGVPESVFLGKHKGGRTSVTALGMAVQQNQVAVVKMLLAAGATPALETHDHAGSGGISPLRLSCEYGSLDCVKLLLATGVSAWQPTFDTERCPMMGVLSGGIFRGGAAVVDCARVLCEAAEVPLDVVIMGFKQILFKMAKEYPEFAELLGAMMRLLREHAGSRLPKIEAELCGYLEQLPVCFSMARGLLLPSPDETASSERLGGDLAAASLLGASDLVQSLLSAHADVNHVWLRSPFEAQADGKPESAPQRTKADPLFWTKQPMADDRFVTAKASPLFCAIVKGHLAVVKRLLDAGARVNEVNTFIPGQSTPLLLAAGGVSGDGHHRIPDAVATSIMKELIEHGADVNYRDDLRGNLEDAWAGATAMHLSVMRRNYEGVKLLQKAGLGGTTKNSKGQSALEFAQQGAVAPGITTEYRAAYERIIDLLERNLGKFCAVCGALPSPGKRLQKCDACKLVCYCGREHQVLAWKMMGHKHSCGAPLPTSDSVMASSPAKTIAVLREFGQGSVEVARWCFESLGFRDIWAIMAKSQGDEGCREIVGLATAGLIAPLMGAMKAHPESVHIQTCGLYALHLLSAPEQGASFSQMTPRMAKYVAEANERRQTMIDNGVYKLVVASLRREHVRMKCTTKDPGAPPLLGEQVRIHGVKQRPELNGKVGMAEAWEDSNPHAPARYRVAVPGLAPLALKPCNLSRLSSKTDMPSTRGPITVDEMSMLSVYTALSLSR